VLTDPHLPTCSIDRGALTTGPLLLRRPLVIAVGRRRRRSSRSSFYVVGAGAGVAALLLGISLLGTSPVIKCLQEAQRTHRRAAGCWPELGGKELLSTREAPLPACVAVHAPRAPQDRLDDPASGIHHRGPASGIHRGLVGKALGRPVDRIDEHGPKRLGAPRPARARLVVEARGRSMVEAFQVILDGWLRQRVDRWRASTEVPGTHDGCPGKWCQRFDLASEDADCSAGFFELASHQQGGGAASELAVTLPDGAWADDVD